MPPERSDGRGPLLSLVAVTQAEGGCVEHPEFVVYKETQSLPQYAIWYQHSARCQCTHCWKLSSIDVIVRKPCGTEQTFSIQRCSKLRVLFDRAKPFLAPLLAPKFTHLDSELTGDETPIDLSMENGAVIVTSGNVDPDTAMRIKVVTPDGNEVFFKMRMTTPLQRVITAFCNRQGVAADSLRFKHDGEEFSPNETPADLGMEDGDTIYVVDL